MRYKKRVVGAYRHKRFTQCMTAQIAMAIFWRFGHGNNDCEGEIDFLRGANPQRDKPVWQKKYVLENWRAGGTRSGEHTCESVYKRFTEQANVSWNKVTHLRQAGMEYASASGVGADALATMSKHRGEKLFDAYMTELYPDVMLVMSGHRPGDSYFVPRTEVELPYPLERCIEICFPAHRTWTEQWNGGATPGDNHESAKNFLVELVPYLTRVIVQDAPYWLKHYPDHEYTQRIQQIFPMDFWQEGYKTMIRKAESLHEKIGC